MDDVFSHKGRKFRRRSQPLLGNHNFHLSPPPPPPQPILSRSVLLPPPVTVSKARPMSAKTRPQPMKLDPSEHRMQFTLQHSKPLPPIADTSSSIYEVDSAVDLDYISQCGTPLTPPIHTHYCTTDDSVISSNGSPKLVSAAGQTTVQLGLKLPNSDRIEHHFPLTATIQDIIDYAQRSCDVLLQDCTVSINGLTRTVLNDKFMTLKESGINVRTVLYLTLP